jgi:hypothetical protein
LSRKAATTAALLASTGLLLAVSSVDPGSESQHVVTDGVPISAKVVRLVAEPVTTTTVATTTTTIPPTTTTTVVPTTTTTVTPTTSAPPPTEPAPPAGGGYADPANYATWDRLAQCESGGDWHINTGNGYFGGLQFSLSSWQGVGGSGYPHEASREEQIRRGQILQASGGWGHWPACSSKLGYR